MLYIFLVAAGGTTRFRVRTVGRKKEMNYRIHTILLYYTSVSCMGFFLLTVSPQGICLATAGWTRNADDLSGANL